MVSFHNGKNTLISNKGVVFRNILALELFPKKGELVFKWESYRIIKVLCILDSSNFDSN